MYLRVINQEVMVTCNHSMSIDVIEKFINKHKRWIINRLNTGMYDLYPMDSLWLWGKLYKVFLDANLHTLYRVDGKNIFLNKRFINEDDYEFFYHQVVMDEVIDLLEQNKDLLNDLLLSKNILFKTQLMRSRLGSCHSKKETIKINTLLGRMDKRFLKLVLFHEITHFKHLNHSDKFHEALELIYPNHRKVSRLLNQEVKKFKI